jgi:hypothetical protein
MDDSFRGLLKILLPPILFEYFELIKMDKQEEVLHLYLEELNEQPKEFSWDKLQSKGLFDEITIQDFPIRGHQAFLHVKRRRWINESKGKVVYRNWDLVAKGTRLTSEFASFLKEISRYQ